MTHMTLLDFFQFVLWGALAYYGAILAGLTVGLKRVPSRSSSDRPRVSVIVAARNEENSIGRLLESLVNQDYPDYEIVVANDRSTDGTGQIIADFASRDDRVIQVRVESPSPDMPAKKHALAQAIKRSRGELLCFTDADCIPGRRWIAEIVKGFDPDVGLVAGYSPYDTRLLPEQSASFLNRTLHQFVDFEEFKGAIWAAGSIGLRRGWLCTGRNLAYRRAVWEQVGGFESIKQSVSGDDDLLLQVIRRSTPWQIHYVYTPESKVVTAPPSSLSEFIRQRRRHFSAGRFFSFPMKIFFFMFHLSNLLLFLGLLTGIFNEEFLSGLWAFFGKACFDALLLSVGAAVFQLEGLRISFLFLEILYVLYNTFIGPLGFIGTVQWKPQA